MEHRRLRWRAQAAAPGRRVATEVRTDPTERGDVVALRVDPVHGNVVTVLEPGAAPVVTARPGPVRLLPRPPTSAAERREETDRLADDLLSRRTVAVHGPAGAGKSTLLRHLAHHPALADGDHGVVHVCGRGLALGDLLHVVFHAFHATDVPMRPSAAQLRHHLMPVRAALLVDDADLTDDEVTALSGHLPRSGIVLTSTRPCGSDGAQSMALPGLPIDPAARVLERAFGRTLDAGDRPAARVLRDLVDGVPGRLLQMGACAAVYGGSLTEYAVAEAPVEPVPADEARVLGLLVAVPGLALDQVQLAAVAGVRDVQRALLGWLARGLVTTADPPPGAPPARRAYRITGGVTPDSAGWLLDERRAELRDWFTAWARQHPDAELVPGGTAEPVRLLHADARRGGHWRHVLALGPLLEAADARAGRWNAWLATAEAALDAARALGDRPAEVRALHQVGTAALCLGDLERARERLGVALRLRCTEHDREVTRANLATIGALEVRRPAWA